MTARFSVLLVDDEPALAKLYGTAVQRQGFEALATTDADDALNLALSYRPPLIICDVQMPGRTGFDLAREIVAAGAKNAPLIFLSGYDDPATIMEGLDAGGDDFIHKGLPAGYLIDRVRFWLRSGFRGLPQPARQRLLKNGKDEAPLDLPGRIEGALDDELIAAVADEVEEELRSLAPEFGARLVERIALLGRIHGMLDSMQAGSPVDIRFADYVDAVVARLAPPWAEDANVLFSRYDQLTQDSRFLAALDGLSAFEAANLQRVAV